MTLFLSSFISLLIIVDPPGSGAIFSILTKDQTQTQRKLSAVHSVLIASCILVFSAFFGQMVLTSMNVSLDVVRVIGGALLAFTAFNMVFNGDRRNTSPRCIAFYPMGTHLLAGPGCISVVILSMDKVTSLYGSLSVLLAILAVQAVSLVSMLLASQMLSSLGSSVIKIISQFMGMVLGGLALFMFFSGLQNIFTH